MGSTRANASHCLGVVGDDDADKEKKQHHYELCYPTELDEEIQEKSLYVDGTIYLLRLKKSVILA